MPEKAGPCIRTEKMTYVLESLSPKVTVPRAFGMLEALCVSVMDNKRANTVASVHIALSPDVKVRLSVHFTLTTTTVDKTINITKSTSEQPPLMLPKIYYFGQI